MSILETINGHEDLLRLNDEERLLLCQQIREFLIEKVSEDGKYFIGRTYMDVPSEDEVIYIKYDSNIIINEFVKIKIVDAMEYDLVAEIVKEQ